jgi:hypothetical protein
MTLRSSKMIIQARFLRLFAPDFHSNNPRWKENPLAGRRKGRLEAILEIPQWYDFCNMICESRLMDIDGILKKYKAKLQVGSLDTKKAAAPPTPPATPPPAAKPAPKAVAVVEEEKEEKEPLEQFGDMVPYADPSWYQTVRLPTTHPNASEQRNYARDESS